MSGEGGQPACHGYSQYIYQKEHAGAPFALALLSSLLYLVGTDVMELVDRGGGGVVLRHRQVERGDTDVTERVNPFCRVGSFYVAGDMARL